jgi:hypothetical protein
MPPQAYLGEETLNAIAEYILSDLKWSRSERLKSTL